MTPITNRPAFLKDSLKKDPKRRKRVKRRHKRASPKIENTFETIIANNQSKCISLKSERFDIDRFSSENEKTIQKEIKEPVTSLSSAESTVIQTAIPAKGKKRAWQILKCVAEETYKAITYNGQKDVSLKPKHTATRVAAVALPFIQYLIPQTQIVTGVFKACYQIAEMTGAVSKTKTAKKKTLKGAIESPLTKTILGVAVVVAAFFASRVAIVACSALKIGLDVMDLRNSIVSDGFTKDSVLILIKLAGSVAYLALAIFDSNIALIFSISAKLANNVFTAYCEASQGRYVEAIAALAFGCLSNFENIKSVSTSAEDNTLLKSGEATLSAQDMAGVTNMNPAKITPSEKKSAAKIERLSPTKIKEKSDEEEEKRKDAIKNRDRIRAQKKQKAVTETPITSDWVIPLYI